MLRRHTNAVGYGGGGAIGGAVAEAVARESVLMGRTVRPLERVDAVRRYREDARGCADAELQEVTR